MRETEERIVIGLAGAAASRRCREMIWLPHRGFLTKGLMS